MIIIIFSFDRGAFSGENSFTSFTKVTLWGTNPARLLGRGPPRCSTRRWDWPARGLKHRNLEI